MRYIHHSGCRQVGDIPDVRDCASVASTLSWIHGPQRGCSRKTLIPILPAPAACATDRNCRPLSPGYGTRPDRNPMNSKSFYDLRTDFFTVIVCIAMMHPVFLFEPFPFIFCHDMITKDDRCYRCRKDREKNSRSRVSSDEMGTAQAPQQGYFLITVWRISSTNTMQFNTDSQ